MLRKLTGLVVALALALGVLPLAGCWDRSELEERAFVLALGLDRGKGTVLEVTMMIALPKAMAGGDKGGGGGGGGGGDKPYFLTTVQAPTIGSAVSLVNAAINRRVSLLHMKALFMGESLARESGMYTMDGFTRFRQARQSIMYVVTKGRAADFLKGMDPKIETDPQRFIEQLAYNSRYTGMLPAASQIHTFVTTVSTGYIEPVTYYAALKEEGGDEDATAGLRKEVGWEAGELPRTGGPNIEMLGAAAFRGERMVGVLTGGEIRMILMMQDRFNQGFFAIPDPRQPELFVSAELHRGRPFRLELDLGGDKPRLRGLITLEAELLATQGQRDYTAPHLQAELESAITRELESRIRETIRKTQGMKADVIGFGYQAVRQFPTVRAWEAYNWPDKYADADVEITVRVVMRRAGIRLRPPKMRD